MGRTRLSRRCNTVTTDGRLSGEHPSDPFFLAIGRHRFARSPHPTEQ